MFHNGVPFSWGCLALRKPAFSFLHHIRIGRLRVAAVPGLSIILVFIVVVPDGDLVLGPGCGSIPHVVVLGFDGCDLGLFWSRGFSIIVAVPFALCTGGPSPGGCGQRSAHRGGSRITFERFVTGPATPPAVVLAGSVLLSFLGRYSR